MPTQPRDSLPRCPSCDRAECLIGQVERAGRGGLPVIVDLVRLGPAQRDCEIHRVDWRARCLAAESLLPKEPPPTSLPPDWTTEPVHAVFCPACAFGFAAYHVNADGTYSCPNCAEAAAESRAERAEALLVEAQGQVSRDLFNSIATHLSEPKE